MLQSLTIKNYKSFKHRTRLEIKPITVLVGTNSSGKSSIIKLLAMLHQSYAHPRRGELITYNGPVVDMGDFKTISHRNLGEPIEIALQLRVYAYDGKKRHKITTHDREPIFAESEFRLLLTNDTPSCIFNSVNLRTSFELNQQQREKHLAQVALLRKQVEELASQWSPQELEEKIKSIKERLELNEQLENRATWPDETITDGFPIHMETAEWTSILIERDSPVTSNASSLIKYASRPNPINLEHHVREVLAELEDLLDDLLIIPKVSTDTHLSKGDVRKIIADRLSSGFELAANGLSFVNFQFIFSRSNLLFEKPAPVHEGLPSELNSELFSGRRHRKSDSTDLVEEDESVPRIIARLMSQEENRRYQPLLFRRAIDFINEHVDRYLIEEIMYSQVDTDDTGYEIDEYSTISRLQRGMMKTLGAMTVIGPLRAAPRRFYTEAEFKEWMFGTNSEYILNDDDLGQMATDVSSNLTALGADYQISIEKITQAKFIPDLYALTLTENISGVTQSYLDVGFGLSQIIPILVKLRMVEYLSYSDPFVIIEQPELHLHPRSQARLANVFSDWLKRTTPEENWKQLLLETHSEHLVRGFQVQVAKGYLSPDDIAIYYVDKDEAGNSFVKYMPLDEDGSFIEPWPEGFFDQAYLQAMELLTAQQE